MKFRIGRKLLCLAIVSTVVVGVVSAFAAGADTSVTSATVGKKAAAFTPYLTSPDSQVTQIVQCGSLMYAVGEFSEIGLPDGTTYARSGAFSFDAATGAVSAWDPAVTGRVESIAVSADCASAYLGGTFSSVDGTAVTNLAEVDTASGDLMAGFDPAPDGTVFTLALTGSQLLAGGAFTEIGGSSATALASVATDTGALTDYDGLAISGKIPGGSGATRVYKLRVSPDGTRVLALGNFTHAGSAYRRQAFVADLGADAATLDDWYAPKLHLPCGSEEPFYARAATWSPDGSRIYVATTGESGVSPLCDSVSAFSSTSASHSPIWINMTGCDSLYAVAASATAVYVGGHERYANNALGCDSPGTGSVSRPGVGAFSPSTGLALSWDPTRSRGKGADDELLTSTGLWIASDNFYGATSCAGAYHPGICFLPNA